MALWVAPTTLVQTDTSLKLLGRIVVKLGTDVHGTQRRNPNDFSSSPPAGQNLDVQYFGPNACKTNDSPVTLCLVPISRCWHTNTLKVNMVSIIPGKYQHASIITVSMLAC